MKSRRNKTSALRGPFRGHRAQFESLEPRRLLTVTPVAGATEVAFPLAPFVVTPPLPAPTISLPTVLSPINGGLATPIAGVWVSDAGSDALTVTLSVEHGTLSISGNGNISGNGTSTIVLTGTTEEIYDELNPPGYTGVAVNAYGSISTSPANGVYYGGGLVYTADSGFAGTDVLTVLANASASLESPNPVLPLATIEFSPFVTSTLLLDVVPQVSAPVINAPSSVQPIAASAPAVIFQGTGNTISISDPNVGSQPVQVTLAVDSGTLNLSGTAGLTISGGGNGADWMTLTGSVTDINTALDGLTYTPGSSYKGGDRLVVQMSDLGNTGLRTPQTTWALVSIETPWLLVPSSTQNVNPGSPLVFNTANGNAIVANDFDVAGGLEKLDLSVDGGTLTLAQTTGLTFVANAYGFVGANGTGSMTIEGSQTDINNALAGLTYTPAAGFTGPDTLTLNVYDLGSSSQGPWSIDSETVGIQVGPSTSPIPSSPPTITAPQSQTTGLSTPTTFSSAGGNAIAIVDPGAAGGIEQLTLAVHYGIVSLGRTTGLTVTSGANGSAGMTIEGTVAALDAALDGLVYKPTGLFAGEDTLSLSYVDKTVFGGPKTVTGSTSIFVATPNQAAPVIAPRATQNATPNTPVVFTAASGNAISVSVPGVGATVPIQVTLSVGAGTLALSGNAGLTMVSGANDSASMTIKGTVAAINAALDGLAYTPGSGDTGRTELDVLVNMPGSTSVSVPQGVVWLANGPSAVPAPITVPATQNVAVSTPVIFSNANQNAILVNGAATQIVQLTLSATCTFGVGGAAGTPTGTLTLSDVAGLTFAAGGNGTASMTISGTVADIDRALDGLTYTPLGGNLYWDTISVDLNYQGSGGPQTAQSAVAISPQSPPVDPDSGSLPSDIFAFANPPTPPPGLPAPVITMPGASFPVPGSPGPITGVTVSGAAMIDETLSVENGTLQASAVAGVIVRGNGTSTIELIGTAADVNAALLTYTADAGFSGSDSLTVGATAMSELPPPLDILNPPVVNLGPEPVWGIVSAPVTFSSPGAGTLPLFSSLAALGWNPVESLTTTSTLSLNVAPPTLDTPGQQTFRAPASLVFSAANNNAISITDPGAGTQPVQVTLGVTSGMLTLGRTTGITFKAGENGAASMTLTGSLANIDSALDGLTYSVKSSYAGGDTLSVSYNELGTGSSQKLSASVPIVVQPAYVQPTVWLSLPTGPVSASRGGGGSLSGVSVSETGNGPIPPLQVTISVQHGTLNVAQYYGMTITGDGTSTVVMTGTVQAIDAALDGGQEQPPIGYLISASPLTPIAAITNAATATGSFLFDYQGLTYEDNIGYVGSDTFTISVKTPAISHSPTTTGSVAISVANTGAPSLIPSQTTSTYTIGGVPLTIDPGIVLISGDADLTGARVTFWTGSLTQLPPGVALNFTNQNGITGSYADGALSLTGNATPAEYQAALRSVTFSTTSTTPTSCTVAFIAYDNAEEGGNLITEQVNVVAAATTPPPVIVPMQHGRHVYVPTEQHGRHLFGSTTVVAVAGTSVGDVALAVQEAGSAPASGSQANAASSTASACNAPTSSTSLSSSASLASTPATLPGSPGSSTTLALTSNNDDVGCHQFAATEEAVSDFDLADLYV